MSKYNCADFLKNKKNIDVLLNKLNKLQANYNKLYERNKKQNFNNKQTMSELKEENKLLQSNVKKLSEFNSALLGENKSLEDDSNMFQDICVTGCNTEKVLRQKLNFQAREIVSTIIYYLRNLYVEIDGNFYVQMEELNKILNDVIQGN